MAGLQTKGSRTAGKAATGDGRILESDRREMRHAARQRDEPLERAYNAGRRGDDPAEFQTDDELWGYYQDGAKAARGERRQERTGAAIGKAGATANDGAGFLLGLIGYAIMAAYLRGGVGGVRAWFAAKFLNHTIPTAAATPAKPATPSTPAPAQLIRVGS